MRKVPRLRTIALVVLVVVLIGPFVIPAPPLKDTRPPEELADPDSKFIDVNNLRVHYKVAGAGEPVFVLLHGFVASVFSWREVMQPLARLGRVIAFDRPAFGLTSRPMPGEWTGENPYSPDAQVALTIGLMDRLGVKEAILVGHSAGGTIAMLTALRHPQRVQALVLISPAIYGTGGAPAWLRPLFSLPQVARLGPLLARSIVGFGENLGKAAFHDPSKLTPDVWEGYRKPLQVANWDRALWEFTRASRASNLAERAADLHRPVLVITGDDDRIVPAAQSARLADALPDAQLVVIPECGHIAHEEKPGAVMQALMDFLTTW